MGIHQNKSFIAKETGYEIRKQLTELEKLYALEISDKL